MTINKEQPVSDAMIEAGLRADRDFADGTEHRAVLCEIYLAMKAASHPLEQQAVRMREALEQIVDTYEGRGRWTTGEGHAECVEIARTALQEGAHD